MTIARAFRTLALVTLIGLVSGHAGAQENVLVFAAASVAPAVRAAAQDFTAKTGVTVTVSGAATSALAQQISRGAPAHLFISAHPRWMAVLADRSAIDPARQTALLGNELVLIAPRAHATPLDPTPGFAVRRALGVDGRLALGDPDHVPAGVYAKQALSALGVWNDVTDRLAPTGDVIAALTFVARGEAPLGIVYRTDAAMSDAVSIIGTFPANTHDPIRYDVAPVTRTSNAASDALLRYLISEAARSVFERFGFVFLPRT
ncbi:MAG: molybdate ABC transporter substrate-binding protein [Alphaproteobacteria bacterium]|nr:molybdate ABC transporter substrate-binding protein [Alphaproteobacteria bacterium]